MNLNGDNWLPKYISFRSTLDPETMLECQTDQKLYKLVQPTGMLYGHPVQLPYHDLDVVSNLIIHDKMRVIMVEGMFYQLLEKNPGLSESGRSDLLHESIPQLIEFYENLYPNLTRSRFSFGKKVSDPVKKAELLIDRRTKIRGNFTKNFWKSFFHNSLLFLDLYYFGEWRFGDLNSLETIAREKEEMRLFILKVIAAAAHADNILEREEETLFTYFLKSAQFSKEKEQEATDFIKSGIRLDELEVPNFRDSWLLKKYVLEMAILTIWADKIVKEEERQFLKSLCLKLGFSELELECSMLSLEAFVLENWQNVHYLRNQREFKMVSEMVVSRLQFFVNMNKDRVVKEINESKELMQLLSKSRKEELTPEEKVAVRTQLIDILKLIPAFVVIVLPFTIITLPILLKILPKSAFPTAFQE